MEFAPGTYRAERRAEIIWELPRVKNSYMKESTEATEFKTTSPQLVLSSDWDQNQIANWEMVQPKPKRAGSGGENKNGESVPHMSLRFREKTVWVKECKIKERQKKRDGPKIVD